MAAKPLSPDDVDCTKTIPDEVIEIFNNLIKKNLSGSEAVIDQAEAASLVAAALSIGVDQVYKKKLLDVEDIYRKAGWNVDYYPRSYNETYVSYFIFRKKAKQ